MGFVLIPALVSLSVFSGLYTYRSCERRHRSKWQRAHEGTLRKRAPEHIRRTALWSIYMGQMALPGGLLGLFGMLAMGLGLVSIPGMILAVRIWRLGFAMLRRDPDAEAEARKLERFAVVLNLVGVAVAVVLFFVFANAETGMLSLFILGYAAVSFAHAKAMRRCAELLAAERRLDEAAQLGGTATPVDRSPGR